VIPLRGDVLLPGDVSHFDVGREGSRKAVDAALMSDSRILVVPQQDESDDELTPELMRSIGVEGEIARAMPVAANRYAVVIRALRRVRIDEYVQREPFLTAIAEPIEDEGETVSLPQLTAAVRAHLRAVLENDGEDPDKVEGQLDEIDEPGLLADLAASRMQLSAEQRLELLENPNVAERLQTVLAVLERYVEVLRLSDDIRDELEAKMSGDDREKFLRARMRAIQAELGDTDGDSPELAELEEAIASAEMSEEAADAANKQLRRLRHIPAGSPEHTTARSYIDWLVSLPWTEKSEDAIDVAAAREILAADHDGLEDVKKRIVEFIAVRKLAPDKRGPILCLVGPPGVGKTSLGRSIARALGRKYVRASLGGVRDEAEIRGHRRTYVGSIPGRIVNAIKQAGTINPVFVLDEIDKLGDGVRGDPASALLEVLDPEQNHEFVDHYLEVPIDLSNVLFLATANRLDTIPAPLRDRMEIIEIPSYTAEEKRAIARHHLVPRQVREHGLAAGTLELSDGALDEIIHHYTREAGVRNLEREIGAVARSVAVDAASDDAWQSTYITEEDTARILGPRRFYSEVAEQQDAVGVVTALSWTPVGGEILFIEARLMPGKGGVKVTGQVGDVMDESVRAAHSWVRANGSRLGIAPSRLAETDLHVHVPHGAIKKDGPSAGVAITTALVSLYTNVPVRHDIAITGEVTLRGTVLPVGGIKEKVLAAHRAGVTTVVLPERNRKDLHGVPKHVLDALELRFATRVDEVLAYALKQPCDQNRREPQPPLAPPRNENAVRATTISAA
jgi:ATP-dependent Lon protease